MTEAPIAAANIRYITVPSNGLFIGLGYSIVFPIAGEIIVPEMDNTINAKNRLTDHVPVLVFGKKVIFI